MDTEQARNRTDLDIGMRRAVLPAFGNDPEMRCEPLGLPRLITFSGGNATMEMVALASERPDHPALRVDSRQPRDLAGRPAGCPNVDDYLPRFNGYSTARWEGDTLVVTSTGFDDRAWLDQYGYPISDKAMLEERWERPSAESIARADDADRPVNYPRPWASSLKVWTLIPKEKMAIGGWSGILEDRCVPSDESLFNQFRDHAAGVGGENEEQ